MNSGESLQEYEARLKADYERALPPTKTVAEMSEPERREALAFLCARPAPMPVMVPFEGAHVRDLSPHQRAEAARQLGIGHLFPTFR